MPTSRDPHKRRRQIANLRQGGAPAPPAGNVRALKHGGTARKASLLRVGSWTERIYAELEAEAPLRAEDGSLPAHDRQIVELAASALARLDAVSAWLETRPPCNEKGEPWPAEDVARRTRKEAAGYLEQLGMTPTARARLGLDLVRTEAAFDMARAMSDLDAIDTTGGDA